MNDLISVIVPVYKVEEYLERCINSILKQTYSNLEIILVDDGSPDLCGKMCDEYARKDSRVRVIHKENGGLSDARNAGIDIASGAYLAFVDSDDWLDRQYIDKLYALSTNTDSDISVCGFLKAFGLKNSVNNHDVKTFEFSNIQALEQLSGKYYIQLVTAWGKLFKRDIFNTVRFPVGKLHEDEYIAHCLLYNANKITLSTEQLYYYWQREDSIMGQNFNIKNKHHAAIAFKERAEFYDSKKLYDLRDNTYKRTFFKYSEITQIINNEVEYDKKADVKEEFYNLKRFLRIGSYNKKFKVYYELYYVIPSFMDSVFKIYDNLKRKEKRKFNT